VQTADLMKIYFQVEEFITQLGIRNLSPDSELAGKQSPVKRKLKTARQHQVQLEDDKSQECMKKNLTEAKKKRNKFEDNNSTTITTKAVDWISHYQPRKYLLVKPGGNWYNDRVSKSVSISVLKHSIYCEVLLCIFICLYIFG